MDEATKLFQSARVERAESSLDTEQRAHDRREKILLAIGAWYASLNHIVPLAMKAESKSVASATEGNVATYRADFLGAEFTARVESAVAFDLDDDDGLIFAPRPPAGFALPPLGPGMAALFVSIFPYANLHSIGDTETAMGSASGPYAIDVHGTVELEGEHVLAILKHATANAVGRE